MSDRTPIRRALLGVYDKTGVEELATHRLPLSEAASLASEVRLESWRSMARRCASSFEYCRSANSAG